jgi:hypothetical protein
MTSARRSQIAPCVGNLEDLVVSAFVDDVGHICSSPPRQIGSVLKGPWQDLFFYDDGITERIVHRSQPKQDAAMSQDERDKKNRNSEQGI